MKKLTDLIQKRSQIINEMEGILEKARTENRSRTEDESNQWKAKRDQVNNLSEEIKTLQEQEELNRSIADQKLDKEEREAVKRYDLSKAIQGVRAGQFDGLERELHQEAEKEIKHIGERKGNLYIPSMVISALRAQSARAAETKTTGLAAGHIPLQVGAGSVITADPLYRKLGVTVYENLSSGKIDLPFSKGHSASSVAESGTATESSPTQTKGTLSAGRFQGWKNYTDEYLAESVLMPQMLADMLAAIDRGVGAALVLDAVAANVMTGYATGDTVAAIAWGNILEQLAELESGNFVSEGFVFSKQLFYELAETEKASGTAKFILENLKKGAEGLVAGIPAHGTSFLPVHDTNKYDSVYGDWKEGYIGFWGGAQLLIDPYSNSDDGNTKITFMRLADVESNPYAFASIRNASIS